MEELKNLQNLHSEKLRLEDFTKRFSHQNMYGKDYANLDMGKEDDRIGMTSEKNLMLIRRVINTGLQKAILNIVKTSFQNTLHFREDTTYAKE